MQDKWRTFNQIDQRIQEQLQKLFAPDKSDNYGISTNLKILTDYIEKLFYYVVGKNSFHNKYFSHDNDLFFTDKY